MSSEVALRPTEHDDLAFVLELERQPENAAFIGQWSETEHAEAIARADREHWVIEASQAPERAGYLISYDLRRAGLGVYVKRIVVSTKSRGLGRSALGLFLDHAFADLSAPFVWLSVFADNTRAQRCYASLGFRARSLGAVERAAHHEAAGGFSEQSLLMFIDRPSHDDSAKVVRAGQ